MEEILGGTGKLDHKELCIYLPHGSDLVIMKSLYSMSFRVRIAKSYNYILQKSLTWDQRMTAQNKLYDPKTAVKSYFTRKIRVFLQINFTHKKKLQFFYFQVICRNLYTVFYGLFVCSRFHHFSIMYFFSSK